MRARAYDDAERFLRDATPLLGRDEARHNLIFGLCSTVITTDAYEDFRAWVVEDGGRPLAVAMQTPPHNLVLAGPETPEALDLLAHAVRDAGGEVPGLGGAVPEVDDFTNLWTAIAGVHAEVAMAQRIYALTEVRAVPEPSGRMRQAREADRELLRVWTRAFIDESFDDSAPERRPNTAETIVDRRLGGDGGGFVLWEDEGEPRSFAGFGGRTPNGMRIGPVYTPPAGRKRGYATALVAALSRRLLEEGSRFCFLYTDLANPTSNSIYAKMGYEPVADARTYRFARA
jgi:predicted GNAT family acetyltransferase